MQAILALVEFYTYLDIWEDEQKYLDEILDLNHQVFLKTFMVSSRRRVAYNWSKLIRQKEAAEIQSLARLGV